MILTYYVVGYKTGCFQPVDVGYGNKRKTNQSTTPGVPLDWHNGFLFRYHPMI